MDEYKDEIELMDLLNVLWKRKWMIILPTFLCVILAGVVSFLLPQQWEVDAVIQPSKFLVQTEQGQFEEIVVTEPAQIAGQINEESYNRLIAAELNLDLKEFPKIRAQNLEDTNLVRISLKERDVEKAKQILSSLFNHLKRDLDKKIDVEIKGIDTEIATNENLIKQKELVIKDRLNEIKIRENEIKMKNIDIQSREIEKTKLTQEIQSTENKLEISKARIASIMEEMKEVKKRIDELESDLRKALAEKKEGGDALSLLLYSNEVQNNLRYYNTLDEKLSTEKMAQENLALKIQTKREEIKQLDTEIEKLKTEISTIRTRISEIQNQIEKIKNEIEDVKNEIALLRERKGRIDYAQLIKEPTSSLFPVSPRKKLNMAIAGILGLMIFILLAFLFEYIEKQKTQKDSV